ncbi:hypothetical protein KUTeg_007151 [Tegillarca granosa]|uniref:Uncharacterized protein n=1 Tax=Tegillarca granosa TaxID=220873 RepID=A0ABQ9FED6_TEGGR|nr:hypothetical protein KUTeg_007151 [Tegillarca granosa]
MAKCRMLLQENEELGKVIASELDEFLGDLEEDVEGMQSMIYVLQQQLKETKEQVLELQNENKDLRNKRTTLENDPESKSPLCSQFTSSSPNRPSQIKEERTDSSQGFYKTCDTVETSSELEMMETDQDPTDTSQSYISGSEVNHITSSHHNKASNQTVSNLKKDNYYDSTDDLSNDPWSSPLQENTEELVNRKDTLEREVTPELEKPSDRDHKTDVLQNGINRTKTEIEEEIDDSCHPSFDVGSKIVCQSHVMVSTVANRAAGSLHLLQNRFDISAIDKQIFIEFLHSDYMYLVLFGPKFAYSTLDNINTNVLYVFLKKDLIVVRHVLFN